MVSRKPEDGCCTFESTPEVRKFLSINVFRFKFVLRGCSTLCSSKWSKIKFSCACHSVGKGHKFSPPPNFCENHRNEVQSRKQHFEQN